MGLEAHGVLVGGGGEDGRGEGGRGGGDTMAEALVLQ